MVAEERQRPGEERGAGRVGLVGQRLGVGQPGAVVDRGVQVVVAEPGLLVPLVHRRVPAAGPPPPAGRDPTELFHVHVHQVTRRPMLIAALAGPGPDSLAGDQVELAQQRQPVTAQDPPDRRRGNAEHRREREWPHPVPATRRDHPPLDRRRRPARAAARCARSVEQRCVSTGLVALPPLAHRLPRDPELFGDSPAASPPRRARRAACGRARSDGR